jgi:hypothetical protein
MFKKKKRKHRCPPVAPQATMPPGTPIVELHKAFIKYETDLGVLDESTIKAHRTRLIGTNGSSPIGTACRNAGLRSTGDLQTVPSRLVDKEIQKVSATRAQANNLKSSYKKSIECNILLGNISLPASALKGIRQQKNRPCSPKQLTDEQIDYYRKSKKGRTPFLAARHDIIGELELLYAVRPGMEITQIDDENVHPLEGYMDILRDDGCMQRLYLRRDTCDRIIAYRRLRGEVLRAAGEKGPVKPFFIKERNV